MRRDIQMGPFRVEGARMRRVSKEFWHGLKQLFTPRKPDRKLTATHTQSDIYVPEPEPKTESEKSRGNLLNNRAPLENLPAEIRRHLLFTLEYEGLKALVKASPTYHQQYLLDRQRLLRDCLKTSLGQIAVDAYAVCQSGTIDFLKARTPKSVNHFLESYSDNRSLPYSLLEEMLTMDEVISIISFHFSIVMPLVRSYTNWALNNLAKETGKESPQSHNESLSKTEKTRLVRALYHFQLYCNLFGVSHCPDYRKHRSREIDDENSIFERFLHIYEPWEVEEMACAFTFSQQKYDQIFKDIHQDVHPTNPYYRPYNYPPTPPEAFDFDLEWSRECLLGGTISCGLKLLHHVLLEVKDHAQLVSVMRDNIKFAPRSFLDDGLDEATQHVRNQQLQDLGGGWRGPPPFQGDSENHAPLAWDLTWEHFFTDWLLAETSLDIRCWGHMIWDAARLERTGGKEVLIRKHEERWKGEEWDASEWV